MTFQEMLELYQKKLSELFGVNNVDTKSDEDTPDNSEEK